MGTSQKKDPQYTAIQNKPFTMNVTVKPRVMLQIEIEIKQNKTGLTIGQSVNKIDKKYITTACL